MDRMGLIPLDMITLWMPAIKRGSPYVFWKTASDYRRNYGKNGDTILPLVAEQNRNRAGAHITNDGRVITAMAAGVKFGRKPRKICDCPAILYVKNDG